MSEPKKTLVEGLKVEEGQQPSKRQIVFNWLMNEDLTKPDGYWGGTEEVERVDALLAALAAQHLKREQEPAVRRWANTGPNGEMCPEPQGEFVLWRDVKRQVEPGAAV